MLNLESWVWVSSSEIMSINDMFLTSDKDKNRKLTATSLDWLQQHAPQLLLPHKEDHVRLNQIFHPTPGNTKW